MTSTGGNPTKQESTQFVASAPFGDYNGNSLVAVSDYPYGSVEIWRLDEGRNVVGVFGRWEVDDGGCCGEVVWLD